MKLRKDPEKSGLKTDPSHAERSKPIARESRTRGAAYTPMPTRPGMEKKRGRGWWMIVAAIVVAGAVLFAVGKLTGFVGGGGSTPAVVAMDDKDEKVFYVADSDIDEEATAAAREALMEGTAPPLPDDVASLATDTIRETLEIAHSVESAAPPSAKERAAAVLATLPEAPREAILEGRQAVFTLQILDTVVEDGDAVSLTLNELPYGTVGLSNVGITLTIALPKDTLSRLRIEAVRDGGGGVTFGAVSSVGEQRTRVMALGDAEEWVIAAR